MNRIAMSGIVLLAASFAVGSIASAAGPTPASWPGNPDGIVLQWENGKAPMLAYDPAGKPVENCFLTPKGLAWLDRNYAMKFQNGAFPLEQGRENILNRIKKTNRLTIEAVITSLYATPDGACNVADKPILSFAATPLDGNFALTQGPGEFRRNGMLSIFLQTTPPGGKPSVSKVDLCYLIEKTQRDRAGRVIGAGEPVHVVITYEPGLLVCYANGKKAAENRGVQGDFGAWTLRPFVFGGSDPAPRAARDRQRNWEGALEGVCLYDRVLSADEAAANYGLYKQRLDARKPVPQLRLQGKLLAKSPAHTAAQIRPYHNELAMYEYEVEKVRSGDYKEKNVRVAQWVLMDDVNLAQAQATVGKSCTLQVEALDDNPQFSSERQSDTLPLDARLARYVDVGPIDETPADPAAIKAAEAARQAREAARKHAPLDLAQVGPNLLKLTGGARTKMAWVRAAGSGSASGAGAFRDGAVMVFDTQEGKERELVRGPMAAGWVWITGDGSRVLYSDMAHEAICVVDWDGSNRRVLAQDRFFNLECYRRDPQTGIEWVYANDDNSVESPEGYTPSGTHVVRIQVDDPSVREIAWNKAADFFSVSADGKFAGGGLPWPRQSIVNLADGKVTVRGTGCRGRIAPDNSYRFFYCDGQHQNVVLHDGDGSNRRIISLIGLRPEFAGQSLQTVNWANDARFLTISAPIPSDADLRHADIYFGRFNESFTAVSDLVEVTDSPVFNDHPYAWVDPKGALPPRNPVVKPLPPRELFQPSVVCLNLRQTVPADWVSPATGMKFKRIPAGSFTTGSKGLTAHRPHEIKITPPFCIGIFDVTQEEWEKVMGNNPSDFKGPTLPVENVSWLDAQEFLKRLSEKDGVAYRLPTDAEWEYACRAGTTTDYYWGAAFDGAHAWAAPNSDGRTHEVGTRPPNAWGLYDMIGNVFEWTSDNFGPDKTGAQADPRNPVDPKSESADPVYRGGAFSSDAEYCSSGTRMHAARGAAYHSRAIGLRVARDVEPGK